MPFSVREEKNVNEGVDAYHLKLDGYRESEPEVQESGTQCVSSLLDVVLRVADSENTVCGPSPPFPTTLMQPMPLSLRMRIL
ncbi:hypothetical protein A0H81_13939 [Grifola frondosa]|uniref:Uncharacterized protein n=1 Tax=Grifola frondosa TaxID=5627 RepID=A0A1C7LNE6_GRIFR|nr:hypothetical protein A0H81_13939 [Grifola frondosa]